MRRDWAKWRSAGPRAHGLSLLEVVVASAILAAALVPIVGSFRTLSLGFRRTTESTHGAYLAEAVLENIRYRLYNFDSRFYTMNQSNEEREKAIAERRHEESFEAMRETTEAGPSGAYARFFKGLADEAGGNWVVVNTAGTSRYFLEFRNLLGSKLHPIGEEPDSTLYSSLDGYSVRVDVSFDGFEEFTEKAVDMAAVKVTVFWRDVESKVRKSEYRTILTRFLYEPHETN